MATLAAGTNYTKLISEIKRSSFSALLSFLLSTPETQVNVRLQCQSQQLSNIILSKSIALKWTANYRGILRTGRLSVAILPSQCASCDKNV